MEQHIRYLGPYLGPDYPQVIGINHRWTISDGTFGRKTWLLLLRVHAATVLYAHIKYDFL